MNKLLVGIALLGFATSAYAADCCKEGAECCKQHKECCHHEKQEPKPAPKAAPAQP